MYKVAQHLFQNKSSKINKIVQKYEEHLQKKSYK